VASTIHQSPTCASATPTHTFENLGEVAPSCCIFLVEWHHTDVDVLWNRTTQTSMLDGMASFDVASIICQAQPAPAPRRRTRVRI
jgi:hypothetical protein